MTFTNATMVQRAMDITYCPNHFLKHNLAHGFFDMFASITQVQSFYIPFG